MGNPRRESDLFSRGVAPDLRSSSASSRVLSRKGPGTAALGLGHALLRHNEVLAIARPLMQDIGPRLLARRDRVSELRGTILRKNGGTRCRRAPLTESRRAQK